MGSTKVVPSDASRESFAKRNSFTFGSGRGKKGGTAAQNAAALKKMTTAQRVTGMTGQELAEQQRQMKAAFLRRQARA